MDVNAPTDTGHIVMPFKKILVALDSSESASNALRVALKLAKSLGSELHLLHVFSYPMQIAVAVPVPGTSEVERDVRSKGETLLSAAAETARREGVSVTTHLLEGEMASTLVEIANDKEDDLIVVGRRVASRLKDVLFGSIADRTVRLAPCPVMVVRSEDDD
jgi:nucleotide-binding universal stress UspA family protein